MNPYLEKVASLTKRAFDVDFEDGSMYGVASNRSMGTPHVHDMLMKAAKDPHIHVGVSFNGEEEVSSKKDPKGFSEVMKRIRTGLGPRPEQLSGHTMDWDRSHTWSMSMDRGGEKVKSYIGKTGGHGFEVEGPEEAVMEHLKKYY